METVRRPLWTKDFIIDCALCFLINLAYYLTMVVVTDYALKKFHASLGIAGLACGIIILGVLAARLFIGHSIERIGLMKCLHAGNIIFLVATIANFWVNDLTLLCVIRFIQGIGFGISSTATATIMAHLVPQERRGEGTAYFAMSVTLATAIGPFAGIFLYSEGVLTTNLIGATVILAICCALTLLLVAPDTREAARKEVPQGSRFSPLSYVEVNALPIAFITFFAAVGYASLLGFMSPFATERGLTVGGKFFFLSYAIFTVITRPITGRLFDLKGENFIMRPAFVLYAIGLCILGVASNSFLVLLAGALIGLGFGTYMSCSQAIVIKVSPTNHMGLANSTFFIFMDLGVGIGPLLLGEVIPSLGFSGMYKMMAIVMLVCLVLYHFLHGRKATRMRQADLRAQSNPSRAPASEEVPAE